jgi:hypothetical protein
MPTQHCVGCAARVKRADMEDLQIFSAFIYFQNKESCFRILANIPAPNTVDRNSDTSDFARMPGTKLMETLYANH